MSVTSFIEVCHVMKINYITHHLSQFNQYPKQIVLLNYVSEFGKVLGQKTEKNSRDV